MKQNNVGQNIQPFSEEGKKSEIQINFMINIHNELTPKQEALDQKESNSNFGAKEAKMLSIEKRPSIMKQKAKQQPVTQSPGQKKYKKQSYEM